MEKATNREGDGVNVYGKAGKKKSAYNNRLNEPTRKGKCHRMDWTEGERQYKLVKATGRVKMMASWQNASKKKST